MTESNKAFEKALNKTISKMNVNDILGFKPDRPKRKAKQVDMIALPFENKVDVALAYLLYIERQVESLQAVVQQPIPSSASFDFTFLEEEMNQFTMLDL